MKAALLRLAAITLLMASGLAAAQSQLSLRFQELNPPRPVSSGDRIEVIEFFYYGCPVCYEAQPHIARWLVKAGPNIALQRVPAPFTESSESFARTFYTLGTMGQIARLHWPLYDNHHFDGKELNEEKNILNWVAGNGVDREKFSELWHSAEITERVASAKKALDTYGVRGVPTFVVDGKYMTSARLAGGTRELMQLVDELVRQAKNERPK